LKVDEQHVLGRGGVHRLISLERDRRAVTGTVGGHHDADDGESAHLAGSARDLDRVADVHVEAVCDLGAEPDLVGG